MKTVSIVVPVYNKEKYVSKCLKSIIDQTFKDIEIIVIDDGSTDKSPKIIDVYAKKYSEIKAIHQENKGRSSARNLGIEKATGKYICFVDADDTVTGDYIEKMYNAITINKADISICEMSIVLNNGQTRIANNLDSTCENITDEFIYSYVSKSGGKYATSSCNKLFDIELFHQNKLNYRETSIGEDFLLCIDAFFVSKRIATVGESLYIYYQHSESTMHSYDSKYFDNLINFMDTLQKYGIQKNDKRLQTSIDCANVKNVFKIIIGKYSLEKDIIEKIRVLRKATRDSGLQKYISLCDANMLAKNYKMVYVLYKSKLSVLLAILCSLYIRRSL